MKPATEFTITTNSGRVLTDADIERMADEATRDTFDLTTVTFLREVKGGFQRGIDGPIFAIWLDGDLDVRLADRASERKVSPASLMRLAVAEFIEHAPVAASPQPVADLSGWQWLLHLDADLAERLQAFCALTNWHINVIVNRAVEQLLVRS